MTTKRKLTFAGMLIAFCLLLCCVFGFLFSTTGGNTAYAYSSSTKYKLDLTATGTSGIYIYVSGATGSGTVSDGAAFNFAPNRVDVVLTKKTELGRYTYTRYVKDFALTGPVTYSSADKQKNSSKSSEKTVTYTLPALTNGSYTLTMTTGQDYSGMIGDASTKVTFNFIVDKNRPTISGASVSTTGKYTNKAFTVTASDLLSGIDKLYWKAPTASIYSSTTATSKTISAGSTNGRYTFYAVDKAGNQSSYYYVYYDNVVPTGTIKETSGTLSSGSYTNKAFSYSATDSGSGINYLQYKKPGSSTWTSYTSGTTIPATSTNGWYYFRAYDNAGNVSAESSVCLDTAVPTGTVYKETTSVSSGSSVKGAYIKFIATDSLSGVANCYVKAPGETSYKSYTSNSPLTTEGVYHFYIVDRAGNQSSTYSIALDNVTASADSYAKLQSIAIYKSVDGGDTWVQLTADDYGTVISEATKQYKFCTSGMYRVVVEDTFHTGFEAIEGVTEYTQIGPAGVLSGVENGGYTNKNVKFTWTDNATAVITVNGETSEYTSGTTLSDDGEYEIVLTNMDGQTFVVSFVIDKIAPEYELTGADNGATVNNDISLVFGEGITAEVSINGDTLAYMSGEVLMAEGEYEFTLTDKAGNKTVVNVFVDKTADYEINTVDGFVSNDDVVIKANEELTISLSKDGEPFAYEFGTSITEEGNYIAHISDAYGNIAEVSFRVQKTVVLNDFAHDFTGVNIVSSTCNGEACELNFAADGKYEITATDGEKEYTFTVTLDRVAPEIVLNGAENGGETKSEVVVESISEEADITVYYNGEKIEYRVGASVSELGEYRIVVTDAAGNTREYTFTIVYGLNGGAIALIVIFVLLIVGIILGIVFGKRAVYKKKLAQKSQEEGSDEAESDMEDPDAANFEPDDEQTANYSEDADEEVVEEVVNDDEDIETDNDEREE